MSCISLFIPYTPSAVIGLSPLCPSGSLHSVLSVLCDLSKNSKGTTLLLHSFFTATYQQMNQAKQQIGLYLVVKGLMI